jgi:NADH-quinone oxidoreductase subunit C
VSEPSSAENPSVELVAVAESPAMKVAKLLQEKFGEAVESYYERLKEVSVYLKREQLLEICQFLHDDPAMRFNLLSDLTGVDLGLEAEPRFEVVYQLNSLPHRTLLRLKVRVSEDDCCVPTVSTIWKTAGWHERETYDLVGIKFDGHPDLRKILTPEDLEGHPLRKDFPLRGY